MCPSDGIAGQSRQVSLFLNEEYQGEFWILWPGLGVRKGLVNSKVPPKGNQTFAQVPRKESAFSQGQEVLRLSP